MGADEGWGGGGAAGMGGGQLRKGHGGEYKGGGCASSCCTYDCVDLFDREGNLVVGIGGGELELRDQPVYLQGEGE